jgi:hypothetical protein
VGNEFHSGVEDGKDVVGILEQQEIKHYTDTQIGVWEKKNLPSIQFFRIEWAYSRLSIQIKWLDRLC